MLKSLVSKLYSKMLLTTVSRHNFENFHWSNTSIVHCIDGPRGDAKFNSRQNLLIYSIQMDIIKKMRNGIFTINGEHTQSEN